MGRMIAALIAAVIAQPLDATYSTAGNPKNCGLNVSFRLPAGWVIGPSSHALGVADFGRPDNDVVMSVWVDDRDLQFPAGAEREVAAFEVYRDALWSVLQRFVPENCAYERAETAVMGATPALKIVFRSGAVNGQVVGFVYERRVVMLWSMCRGPSAGQFDEMQPTFQAVLGSVSVQLDVKQLPFGYFIGGVVLFAIVAGLIVHRVRSTSSKSADRVKGRPGRPARR